MHFEAFAQMPGSLINTMNLRLSLTWLAKLGLYSLVSPPSNAMTQSENSYRQDVFLNDLRQQKDRQQQRIWSEHQQMQLLFPAAPWLDGVFHCA